MSCPVTDRLRYVMIISIPDTITHQEAERKEKFKRNSLTATLFSIYKSKQLLPVNGYEIIKDEKAGIFYEMLSVGNEGEKELQLHFRYFINEPANTIVTEFPIIWLPGFLVPLAYGLHFLSLRQLLNAENRAS